MKNLGLLNKKCSGWRPIDLFKYLRTCENLSHAETEFVDLLCEAMKTIEREVTGKRIFLYNMPTASWDSDTQSTFADALSLFNESIGEEISVKVKRFQPEPEYIYNLVEAKQNGEEVELLFLEELRK